MVTSPEIARAGGPVVSVVIPCRNAEAWIAETVESAAAQTGVDLDLVLVNDGSTDGSVRAARQAGGSRVRVIEQAAAGASQARNAGTAAARGAFLQYLDADDVLEAGTLAARVTALSRTGADVAYCDWVRWERSPAGEFVETARTSRVLSQRPDIDLFTGAWWPPGAVLYRRSTVDRIGPWREDLPVIQDARFMLDAALTGATFVHVGTPGLKYRVHGSSSLSRQNPQAFQDDCYRNALQVQEVWQDAGPLDAEQRRALVKVYASLARGYFAMDRARFREITGRIEQLQPRYLPPGPPAFRALSRLVGFEGAEQVAGWWRQVRRASKP